MILLPRATPESAGLDSAHVLDYLKKVEGYNMHSFMLYRHGKVIAEAYRYPYQSHDKKHIYSVSKTWTSTAVGLAVSDGKLSLDDRVISFYEDKLPETVSDHLANMRVRDLLMMASGHHNDTLGNIRYKPDPERAFLACPVEHEPGTHFTYNSGASFMLASIVTKVVGCDLMEYLRSRLFEPLGLQDISYMKLKNGVRAGGWGLYLSPEDMLRHSILYLNRGTFNGQRILPESWIDLVSSKKINTIDTPDWSQGYGYHFWMCQHNCFRADGAFGQLAIVMPDKDAVCVYTSYVLEFQKLLDAIWKHLYVHMEDEPLPENPAAQQAATDYAKQMSVAIPQNQGKITRPLSGEQDILELGGPVVANVSPEGVVTLQSKQFDTVSFTMNGEWQIHALPENTNDAFPRHPEKAFSAYVTADNTVQVTVIDKNSPHSCYFTISAEGISDFQSNRWM